MLEQKVGTRQEWQVARDELAKLEAEQAARNEEIKRKRRELPWVPVDKEYVFETQEGKRTLAELFDGRSQLLAYNIMYGPDYTVGACPGCTNLADGFDATTLLHLNQRDVTMICFSRRRSTGSPPTRSEWAGSSHTFRRTRPTSPGTSGWR